MPRQTDNTPKKLSFDCRLASTIGLESALLLQYLCQHVSQTEPDAQNTSTTQYTVSVRELCAALSFWDEQTLRKHCDQLVKQGLLEIHQFSKDLCFSPLMQLKPIVVTEQRATNATKTGGRAPIATDWYPSNATLQVLERQYGISASQANMLCAEFILYWSQRGERKHSWDSVFIQHATSNKRRTQNKPRVAIDEHWRPSHLCVQELLRENINEAFIDKTITGYVRYWQEQNPCAGNWDSKFIAHCKRQWRYERGGANGEGKIQPMSEHWQPDVSVYPILKRSNISESYARAQLPEFILYWRERGVALDNWSTCFIRRVKRAWEGECAQKMGGDAWKDFVTKHTDSDWRHGES